MLARVSFKGINVIYPLSHCLLCYALSVSCFTSVPTGLSPTDRKLVLKIKGQIKGSGTTKLEEKKKNGVNFWG